jgi:hypothetical protein
VYFWLIWLLNLNISVFSGADGRHSSLASTSSLIEEGILLLLFSLLLRRRWIQDNKVMTGRELSGAKVSGVKRTSQFWKERSTAVQRGEGPRAESVCGPHSAASLRRKRNHVTFILQLQVRSAIVQSHPVYQVVDAYREYNQKRVSRSPVCGWSTKPRTRSWHHRNEVNDVKLMHCNVPLARFIAMISDSPLSMCSLLVRSSQDSKCTVDMHSVFEMQQVDNRQ